MSDSNFPNLLEPSKRTSTRCRSAVMSVKLWASPYHQLPPLASRPNPIKTEPVDDGRPAPAALPSDCCGRPSPTHSVAGRPSEPAEP